ncbi:hypothetical protein Lal_00015324 [Lupinus albus]|nr:hypothetical protein Lal_00015324 [Lupinus albus]
MTSSSKRPRTSKSKQGESSSKSNPFNLTRLLANDAQRKVFEENFHGRAIFTPKYGDITGFGPVCDWDDYDRKRFYISICRIPKEEIERRKQQSLGETVKNRDILSVGYLTLEEHGETKVALNLRESKIDIEVVRKMGFILDPVTRRTYKHRTDRQTAPTNQLEPTTHYQPEFQAPSSSSATMPSNKMIMDELVSLRGYITTRMDAIDTQNQQIHYELHRLSSRLSSMDIDEDNSEPESQFLV